MRTHIGLRGVVLMSALATGCAEDPQNDAICEDAASALQGCGEDVAAAAFGACEGEDADNAAEIVDAIDSGGCAAVSGGKGDSFLCRIFGIGCDDDDEEETEALWPEPGPATTRFPILLAHGFNTSTTNFWRFNDVDTLLADQGHGDGHVALGSVPPFDTPEVRAGFLAEQVTELLAESGAQKVNLVCFSMGGLDCRALVAPGSEFQCGDQHCGDVVASVTTLSSPNHGTNIADVAVSLLPESSKAIDALATLYGRSFSDVADNSHFIDTMESMTEERFAEFEDDDDPNHIYPKHPDIYYASWAGWSNVHRIPHPRPSAIKDACTVEVGANEPSLWKDVRECDGGTCTELRMFRHEDTNDKMDTLLEGGAVFVAHGTDLIPNDGVSTVRSSIFGEFMGCFPADHLDQVGQINDEGTDEVTHFDYQRLYLHIAEDLATPRERLFPGNRFRRASF